MPSGSYRKITFERTNGNVLWYVRGHAGFSIKRIGIVFETAPSDIYNVNLWYVDNDDSGLNYIMRAQDPNNRTNISFEDIDGFVFNDYAAIQFTNPGGVYVKGTAVISI